MTSSHAFRRFAFAYGTAFAVLYVVALKWISHCSPSIPRWASSYSALTIREIPSIPRWGSLLRRCTGMAGPPRPRWARW